ncbi:hypothetical protein J41TS12_28500 [Paenibacillus antibioticophila]|uniref:Uncharacterized protein n=1 Tax=Paenibacillus antibioticophila TaxID=1274374 RepID=A0A920CI72_9BACL|nr:hypothetical protein [Paenibacillus antibioticophila]GIO37989.1 hypothetical protein J41TS12_28500 [Paenibacillus antibioticophila]
MQTKTSKKLNKPWWESKSTTVLQQFAQTGGGFFVPAAFKNWKYTGQHVRIELGHGRGTLYVTLKDSGSESSHLVTSIQYSFQPRRKFQFHLCKAKRLIFIPFHPELKDASMPNSAMQKSFHAKATHPSLLRQLLKFEGLQEALESKPNAYVSLKTKDRRLLLTLTEASKKPDADSLNQGVQLMRYFIAALEEHGVIRENHR